jgi:hypothetical protein
MLEAQRKALGDRCAVPTAQVEALEGDKENILFGWQQVMMCGGVGAFLCIGRCVGVGGEGGWALYTPSIPGPYQVISSPHPHLHHCTLRCGY